MATQHFQFIDDILKEWYDGVCLSINILANQWGNLNSIEHGNPQEALV